MIVAVAIRVDDETHSLPRPRRHHHIIHALGPDAEDGIQGFIDNKQGFVDRQEAWLLAKRACQLLDRAPTDGRGGTLYSEDIW